MTEVKNNKAFDFLLYSYFGIKESDLSGEDEQNIPYICAKRAYLDLARTVRYTYSSSKLEEMKSKKSSKEDKDKATNFIDSKNELIKNICKNIKDISKYSETLQYYMNIDKLLNITYNNLIKEQKQYLNRTLIPLFKLNRTFNKNKRLNIDYIYKKMFNKIKKIYKHIHRMYVYLHEL